MLLLDKLTAYTGCQAITAALLARSKSGEGQHIELSMLDTAIAFCWADVAADLILQSDDSDPQQSPIDQHPPIGASGHLTQYADGWGATMTLSDAEFQGLCRAFDLPELASDSRFNTLAGRMANREEYRGVLNTVVADAARTLPLVEAEARFIANEVPFARARKLTELASEPQVQNNAVFRTLNHPLAGPLVDARPAPLFGGTPNTPSGPAPDIGEHTSAILADLGMQDRTRELLAKGIVYQSAV
jgi:crotonobetainyl-CoA:carnitine CoA-transferase CaiB-like acyl-CoA transferase